VNFCESPREATDGHEGVILKFWVGVTDNRWFNFQRRTAPDEVNFWQPRGRVSFRVLQPGSLFLFKLKRPQNHIAGGAFFVSATSLPLSLAWESFGIKNGAASFSEFDAMIRSLSRSKDRDPEVGCTVLTQPFFWPENSWLPDPPGFAGNIVRGRYYDTESTDGAALWSQVRERLQLGSVDHQVSDSNLARYGSPIEVRPRLGQGAFRVLVTDAYRRKCAITGESTLPVLEAAHIVPCAKQGPHLTSNGLLLRADFHKLFDLGMVTVTPDYFIEISPKIKEEWFNGKAYYRLHGQRLAVLPNAEGDLPNPEFLRWHNTERFVA
jgi:putative restriction endonuclease